MAATSQTASGVQELIHQIRDEGVQAAKEASEKIIREAKEQAALIRQQAKAETEASRAKAQQEIAAEKTASLEALQLAARDTVLRLGQEVMGAFQSHVKRLVTTALKDESVLRDLILSVAGKSAAKIPAGKSFEILISDSASDEKAVRQFILKITRDMLRDGIELKPFPDSFAGIRVRMKEEDLEIDLTEKAVTELLVQHLLPRYRKIVRGLE